MNKFQSPQGMPDIFDASANVRLETACRQFATSIGCTPAILPVIERSELFNRGAGGSDAVAKEMFAIQGQGEAMALRPEGTVQTLRAWLLEGGPKAGPARRYYIGPMFRNERQQAGRFKQFSQFGIELLGIPGVLSDIDLVASANSFIASVGVQNIDLRVNYIGEPEERAIFEREFRSWLTPRVESIATVDQDRLKSNIFRIIDSKESKTQATISGGPKMLDFLGAESCERRAEFTEGLSAAGVRFIDDPSIVRGLDYYSGPVFEWTTRESKAQNAIAAGGRYDRLSETIGGPKTYASGLAMGMERLLAAIENNPPPPRAGDYIVWVGGAKEKNAALLLARRLRANGRIVAIDQGGRKLAKQFSEADRGMFERAIAIGEREMSSGMISVKNLATGEQTEEPM